MVVNYSDKEVQERLNQIFEDMGLCVCGMFKPYTIVEDMLKRAEARESFSSSGAAVEVLAHVMDGWGLLDHGSSIMYAWLTEDGELLLQFFRDFGTDTCSWPEWWNN